MNKLIKVVVVFTLLVGLVLVAARTVNTAHEYAIYRMVEKTNRRSITIDARVIHGDGADVGYEQLAKATSAQFPRDGKGDSEWSLDLSVIEGMESQGWEIVTINENAIWFRRTKR